MTASIGASTVLVWLTLAAGAGATKTLEPALVIRATTTVAAMPDRRFIFGRDGKYGSVWDALTGELIARVPGYGGALDRKSGNAILGPEVWNLERRVRLGELGVPDKAVVASGFSPDGSKVVVASRVDGAGTVQVWDVASMRSIGRLERNLSRLEFLALTRDAKFLAIGEGKIFDVVELATGRVAKRGALAAVWPFRGKPANGFSEFVDDRARDFDLVFQEAWAPGSGANRPLWVIDWATGRANVFFESSGAERRANKKSPGTMTVASPDRWTAATGDATGRVQIRDVRSRELLSEMSTGGGPVVSLSYSPDAQFLLVGSLSELRVYAISP